jgi:hypothetical protein
MDDRTLVMLQVLETLAARMEWSAPFDRGAGCGASTLPLNLPLSPLH